MVTTETPIKQYAILPVRGENVLCTTNQGAIQELTNAPGNPDARYFLSSDASRVAVLDSARKRVGLFALLDEAPWFRRILPFSTLPKDCLGHVALALGDTLIVGGHGPNHEALWQRIDGVSSDWISLPLPEEICLRGKAVDGLHLQGYRLIVVDDIITPKWLLTYDAHEPSALVLEQTIKLPWHTSYEKIRDSFLGEAGLWCVSRGINHGTSSGHLWLLATDSWQQLAHRSASSVSSRSNQFLFERDPVEPPGSEAWAGLLTATTVVEVAGHVVVACGQKGLIVVSSTSQEKPELADAHVLSSLGGLKRADSLVIPQPHDGSGVFVVGEGKSGVQEAMWLSTGDLMLS